MDILEAEETVLNKVDLGNSLACKLRECVGTKCSPSKKNFSSRFGPLNSTPQFPLPIILGSGKMKSEMGLDRFTSWVSALARCPRNCLSVI